MKKKLSLYLVDDEPKLLELLRMSLSCEDYEINGTCQPRLALKEILAKAESIDILIVDHFMPEMLGTELIATVKSEHPELPIIMATGHAGPDLDEHLKRANYLNFRLVHKPYRRHQLEAILEELSYEANLLA